MIDGRELAVEAVDRTLAVAVADFERRGGYALAAPTRADIDVMLDAGRRHPTMLFAYLNWCARRGMGTRVVDYIEGHCGPLPMEENGPIIEAWVGKIVEHREEIFRIQEEERFHRRLAQRRAFRLLKTFLNKRQREQLDQRRCFHARGSRGGVYELIPATGAAFRLIRRGARWRRVEGLCLHDPDRRIPTADVSLAHLILLRHNEAAFRRIANVTPWLYDRPGPRARAA